LESFDGSKTGALLENAITSSSAEKRGKGHLRLLVDGAGENKGPAVNRLQETGAFSKQVARFEISCVFRLNPTGDFGSNPIDRFGSIPTGHFGWNPIDIC
jgi:hypothetical protein